MHHIAEGANKELKKGGGHLRYEEKTSKTMLFLCIGTPVDEAEEVDDIGAGHDPADARLEHQQREHHARDVRCRVDAAGGGCVEDLPGGAEGRGGSERLEGGERAKGWRRVAIPMRGNAISNASTP